METEDTAKQNFESTEGCSNSTAQAKIGHNNAVYSSRSKVIEILCKNIYNEIR